MHIKIFGHIISNSPRLFNQKFDNSSLVMQIDVCQYLFRAGTSRREKLRNWLDSSSVQKRVNWIKPYPLMLSISDSMCGLSTMTHLWRSSGIINVNTDEFFSQK